MRHQTQWSVRVFLASLLLLCPALGWAGESKVTICSLNWSDHPMKGTLS